MLRNVGILRALFVGLLSGPIHGEDWLAAGVHREISCADGRYQFTALVPEAAAGGKQAPVLIVLPGRPGTQRGLIDPRSWKAWSDRRGYIVLALDQGFTRDSENITNHPNGAPKIVTHLNGALAEAGKRVNLHPVLRVAVAVEYSSHLALMFATSQAEALAGVVFLQPSLGNGEVLRATPKHLAAFLLGGDHPNSDVERLAINRNDLMVTGGLSVVRAAKVKDLDAVNGVIPQDIREVACDHLFDVAMTTNPGLTAQQRLANLEVVVERNRPLLKTVERTSFDYVSWMFTIPPLNDLKKPTPALTTITNEWTDVAIALMKADEPAKLVEAHEFLSIVAKRPNFRFADRDHQRVVTDELKRLRKIPAIKAEVVAADLLADQLAVLDQDGTVAKQRMVLKQLEDLVGKYPATHAGKEAAKLLEPLRRNLR